MLLVIPQMYKIERVFVDTRKRKRRTSLEGAVRSALESFFAKCPKPNTQEITQIADELGLERDVRADFFFFFKHVFLFWWFVVETNDLLCRWCVFGSATGGRKGSAWPCRWTRSVTVSIMTRALRLWAWLPPLSPVKATHPPAATPERLPTCSTCRRFTGRTSWNKPCTPDWWATWRGRPGGYSQLDLLSLYIWHQAKRLNSETWLVIRGKWA